MNHRQWKKRFKKTHGRNPYFWEDKKSRIKIAACKYTAEQIYESIAELPSLISNCIACFMERVGEAVTNLGEAITRLAEEYRVE